jgi:hypothetical protein
MQNLKPLTAAVLAMSLSCAAYASSGSTGGERHLGGKLAGPRLARHGASHGDDRTRTSTGGANPTSKADNRDANLRATVAHRLLNSLAMASALHDKRALRNANARAAVAVAVIEGRPDRDERNWWHHHHGPLFWLFTHYDVYYYEGDGDDYGYDDIYGEIFTPNRRDDLVDHPPPGRADAHKRQTSRATADPVASHATAHAATSTAAAHRSGPQVSTHQVTSKATGHLAMSGSTAQPTTSKATDHSAASQAAAQPATSKAADHLAMSEAAIPPTTSKAPDHPAASRTAAQPTTSKAADHLAMSEAAAPPATPQRPRRPATGQLAQLCSEDSRDIAGLPIDRFQRAIAPDATQLAALDDLGNASMKAAQDIRAGCPTQIPATAPARLAVMQQLVEAMIAAVGTVQPALDKFYGLLNDAQRASLSGIGPNQRSKSAAQGSGALAPNCLSGQPGTTDWPTAEIEAKLHLTDAQRANLAALVDASAKASEMLKEACQPNEALTPPARLAATGKRLEVMLLAIKTVLAELNGFYGQLTDEQKAQFEAIGPGIAAPSGEAEAGEQTPAPVRRQHGRHHAGIGNRTAAS